MGTVKMSKILKTPQNSTKTKKATKKQTSKKTNPSEGKRSEFEVSPWLEDYLDCFSFKYKPVTEAFIERISSELVKWAVSEESSYTLRRFFNKKGILADTYLGWVRKFPTFKAAFNLAKSIIGDRREHGALERKLDSGTVSYMMPYYDGDWKEMLKERNDLKAHANEKNSGGTQFVIMEKFGSSDIVPAKRDARAVVSKTPVSRTPEEVAAEITMMGNEKMREVK